MAWQRNTGHAPPHLIGKDKRVKVRLRSGSTPRETWPVDGRGGLTWALRGFPFDVVEFEEIG
jgi:hypothetical protein